MKRPLIIFFSFLLVMTLFGCGKSDKINIPVDFYYVQKDLSNADDEHIFIAETREAENYQNNIFKILNVYLAGPVSDSLQNPFPTGTKLMRVQAVDNHVQLILTDEFSSLSGVDLTTACACISLTLFDLTEYDTVEIRVYDMLLDGAESITMTRESIILQDDAIPVTD